MTCQRCRQRPSEVHYTEVVGGQKKTRRLCASCARKEGVVGPAPAVPVLEITTTDEPASSSPQPRCDQCGTTLAAIRRTGRVGCGTCYRIFRENLEPLMQRVHRSLEHVGRHPSQRKAVARPNDLRQLRRQLIRAIHDEDYERAARLRDAIHAQERAPGSENES